MKKKKTSFGMLISDFQGFSQCSRVFIPVLWQILKF